MANVDGKASKLYTLYVGDLHPNATESLLFNAFSHVASVMNTRICRDNASKYSLGYGYINFPTENDDENGHSRGYGFVHFEEQEALERAIKSLNGRKLRGRVLYAGHFIPKSERKSSGSDDKFNNCYVKNFPTYFTDDDLNNMFKEFGQIKSAVIMKNDDGSSKGFGFVCFNDPNSAEKALKEVNNKEIGDKPIYVSRAQRKDEREKELQQKYEKQRNERRSKYTQGVNLYVKNLEPTIDDQALHKAFSPYGEITSAIVMRDEDGVSKGFGFVCYAKSDQAAAAITEMYSRKLGNKTIFVGIAERKEDRKKKLDEERRVGITENRAYQMQQALPYYNNTSFVHGQRYMQGAQLVARQRWPQGVMQPPMAGTGNSTYITQSQGAAQPSGYSVQPNYQMRHKSVNPGVPNVVNMTQNNLLAVSRTGAPRQTHMQAANQNVGMPPRISMTPVTNHPNPMGRTAMPTGVQNPNGVRYNHNARNVSTPMGQGQNVQAMDNCGNTSVEKQRNLLGERLYGYIKNLYPEQVAKLTGVLLTMKMEELSALFDDREALKAKVDEAEELLRKKDQVDLEADGATNASKKGKK